MKEWLSLVETLAWVGLVGYVLYRFGTYIEGLLEAFRSRIESGSPIKAGPFELGQDLMSLEKVAPSQAPSSTPAPDDWSKERDGIYEANSGLFLAHVIEPSSDQGQVYDIFIFLVRHKADLKADVEYAEFFLGAHWGNRVFREMPKDGLLGISTSAYGPFLCVCRVKMKDGRVIRLHRYIDFEMGRVFDAQASQALKGTRRKRHAP
ncbi:MAG: hypothetical protein HZC50_12650 [Nitrospirae bacterium]|nr:hypothetical protein [Nitrospirota bacterium]